jgi:hypothetical protein
MEGEPDPQFNFQGITDYLEKCRFFLELNNELPDEGSFIPSKVWVNFDFIP